MPYLTNPYAESYDLGDAIEHARERFEAKWRKEIAYPLAELLGVDIAGDKMSSEETRTLIASLEDVFKSVSTDTLDKLAGIYEIGSLTDLVWEYLEG